MGNCMIFDRPSSAKSQQNHDANIINNHSHLNSPALQRSKSPILVPVIIQQTFIPPSSSPVSTPTASNRVRSSNAVRSPSSSGISSASSSTASANLSKSPIDNVRFQYVAIFDYDARTKEDLTMRKGDFLEITNRKSTAWWKAKNENGQEGWIPSNYVAKRDSLESEP